MLKDMHIGDIWLTEHGEKVQITEIISISNRENSDNVKYLIFGRSCEKEIYLTWNYDKKCIDCKSDRSTMDYFRNGKEWRNHWNLKQIIESSIKENLVIKVETMRKKIVNSILSLHEEDSSSSSSSSSGEENVAFCGSNI